MSACTFPAPRDTTRSRWTVIEEIERRNGRRRVIAECSCGTVREVTLANITSGASLSCGCMKENLGKRRATHDERFWRNVPSLDGEECRWMYLAVHGDIPDGLVIDHACHNLDESCAGGPTCRHRQCVNPAHLEATTNLENVMAGKSISVSNAAKTHCIHGHEFTPENTYVRPNRPTWRCCRACRRADHAKQSQRRRTRRATPTEVAA